MGLDCTYQAVPADLELIMKAAADSVFAENVFYPFIAFCDRLESSYYFSDVEFDEIRLVYQQHSDIKIWSFKPVSRMQSALVYLLDPELYKEAGSYTELEKTFAYRFVHGESVFSNHLVSTQGIPVRVSSPDFISECVKFLENCDSKRLKSNFDIDQMSDHGLYKIGSDSTIDPILNYFNGLADFYRRISKIGNLSLFIIVD
jgi:Domain of unknown function (DUF1877)